MTIPLPLPCQECHGEGAIERDVLSRRGEYLEATRFVCPECHGTRHAMCAADCGRQATQHGADGEPVCEECER